MSKVKWAFIYNSPGVRPDQTQITVEGDGLTTLLVAVNYDTDALEIANKLIDQGVQFVEFCGSFAKIPNFVEQVMVATKNRVPVGAVTFASSAANQIAAIFATNQSWQESQSQQVK